MTISVSQLDPCAEERQIKPASDALRVLRMYEELEKANREQTITMRGTIRPRGKCPKCHESFKHTSFGYICEKDLIAPKKYMIDGWHQGERFKVHCDKLGNVLDSYTAAQRTQADVTADINNNTFRPRAYRRRGRGSPLKFRIGNGLGEFIKRKAKAKNTRKAYNKAKKVITAFFNERYDMRSIGTMEIHEFFMSTEGRGVAVRITIVTCLIACLHYHRKNGMPGPELCTPQSVLDLQDEIRKNREANKDIPAVEKSMDVLVQLPPLERLACFVMGGHGRRPGEILALQKKHFNFQAHTFTLIQHVVEGDLEDGTKTKPREVCHIHDELYDELYGLCSRLKDDDYVFSHDPSAPGNWQKLSEQIKKLALEAGLKCSAYEIVKHSFVSSVAGIVGDPSAGKDLTQHESAAVTGAHYINLLPVNLKKQRNVQKHISFPKDNLPGFSRKE